LSDPVMRAALAPLIAEALREGLRGLSAQQSKIVEEYVGLEDDVPKPLDKIGMMHGVTELRIEEILSKALSRLRHATRAVALEDLLDDDGLPAAVLDRLRRHRLTDQAP
jgi:DNA-directed RNA polymerase sigma subunit (sigma70/sigma32)